jgi:hypothetical protein
VLLAAASTALAPRAVLSAVTLDQAREFARRVRLGQTERSSSVLTVQSPVRPQLDYRPGVPAEADVAAVPYERRVMRTLARSLDAVRRSAVDATASGSAQSFVEAVELGVSANLCEAVAGMLDAPETQALSVRFTWSPVRPEQTDVPALVSFTRVSWASWARRPDSYTSEPHP